MPPLRLSWTLKKEELYPRPLLVEGKVVLTAGRGAVGLVEEGQELWWREGSFYSVRVARGRIVASNLGEGEPTFVEIDLETGALVRSEPCDISPTVLLPEKSAFVGESPYREEHPGYGTRDLALVDLDTLEPRWRLQSRRSKSGLEDVFGTDVACGEGGVFVGKGKYFLALDLGTGEERWATRLHDFGGAHLHHLPMVAGNRVVIRTSRGTVALDTATGRPHWLVKGMSSGGRTIQGGRVYMALPNTEFRLADLESGEVLLEVRLEELIRAKWRMKHVYFGTDIVVGGAHFFIGDGLGRLYAFEKESAEPVWFHKPKGTNGYLGAYPAVEGDRLCLTTAGDAQRPGALYCYQSD
jgi:outer membrane protein assembly factor BamB